jgi:geranylgeranyl pyrophosphate synthase
VDNIRRNAAIEKAMDEARKAVSRALDALEDAPDSPERGALEDLAKFIVDRKI